MVQKCVLKNCLANCLLSALCKFQLINCHPECRSLVVALTFDYATQGEFRIALLTHSPRSPGFSDKLPALLREHAHGQLVLFTSRRQMQTCHGALPRDLLEQVQGVCSRTELLRERGRRMKVGERLIFFGLQSFGEAIEVPGLKCCIVSLQPLLEGTQSEDGPSRRCLSQERFVRLESRLS